MGVPERRQRLPGRSHDANRPRYRRGRRARCVRSSASDERIPQGREYVRRLLEQEYGAYDIDEDFPLVEDRGKTKGTETYAISSTRPIDSPAEAGIAVTGGAMGATSAFHEGGDHVAVRTGAIAGRLAANDRLERYNDAWHDAIGDEILRNVTFADMVRDWRPGDWDRAFRTANDLMDAAESRPLGVQRRQTRHAVPANESEVPQGQVRPTARRRVRVVADGRVIGFSEALLSSPAETRHRDSDDPENPAPTDRVLPESDVFNDPPDGCTVWAFGDYAVITRARG